MINIVYWKLLVFVLLLFDGSEIDIENIDLNEDYFHTCYFVDNGSLYNLKIYSGIESCEQIDMISEIKFSSSISKEVKK